MGTWSSKEKRPPLSGFRLVTNASTITAESEPVTDHVLIQNAALVCCHWMRICCISTERVSYDDIPKIVLNFYFVLKFEWDTTKSNEGFAVSKRRNAIHRNDNFVGWKTVIGKHVRSKQTVWKLRWELTLMGRGEIVSFRMGFLAANFMEQFDWSSWIGATKYDVALWVDEGSYPKVFTENDSSFIHTDWTFNLKDNPMGFERFCLEFDFKEKKCRAFFNDELIGLVANWLPRRLYPAVSVYYPGCTLQTTMYKLL